MAPDARSVCSCIPLLRARRCVFPLRFVRAEARRKEQEAEGEKGTTPAIGTWAALTLLERCQHTQGHYGVLARLHTPIG